ncbi:MAG: hypothetical protein FWD72_05260 [Eggerthellaceae bacterium]|nr:hypothetical protein [Eggerthellaceae bacterium]
MDAKNRESSKKGVVLPLVATVLAVVGLVVFFLTEDLNSSIILFNWWTVAYAAVFAGEVAFTAFVAK